MTNKHTPEPWACEEPNGRGNGWKIFELAPLGRWPKTIAWLGQDTYSDETARNARMIAGSPEMFEALQAVWIDITSPDNDSSISFEAGQKVRAAIEKATGIKL